MPQSTYQGMCFVLKITISNAVNDKHFLKNTNFFDSLQYIGTSTSSCDGKILVLQKIQRDSLVYHCLLYQKNLIHQNE